MASINNAESGDPRNSLLSPGDKVVTRTRLGRQESKTPPSRQLVTINDGDDNYDQDDEDHILPQMSTESTPLLMSPPHPSPSLRDKKRSSASYSKSWAASFSHTLDYRLYYRPCLYMHCFADVWDVCREAVLCTQRRR
eukprot:gene16619-18309_t